MVVIEGESIFLPNGDGLIRENYVFGSWMGNFGGSFNAGSIYTPTNNVVMSVRWLRVIL